MMGGLQKWILYFASYRIAYFVIMVIKACDLIGVSDSETDMEEYLFDFIIIVVCMVLLLLSTIYVMTFFRQKNNVRISMKMVNNAGWDNYECLTANIATTIVPIVLGDYGFFLGIIVFIVYGFIFVGSNKVQTSPIFLSRRYKVYENSECYVLTKMSMESFNIEVEEQTDGVEVRELVKGVYVMF